MVVPGDGIEPPTQGFSAPRRGQVPVSVRVGSGGFSVPNENVTTDRDVTDQPQSTRPRHENGQSRGTVRFVNAAPKDRIVENALAKAADDLGVPNESDHQS